MYSLRGIALTAGVALLAALAPAGERDEPAKAAGGAEPAASVLRMSGTVEYRSGGAAAAFRALVMESALLVNDEVRTGRKSAVELRLADGARLTLGAESSLVIRAVRSKVKPDETLLDLDGGSLGVAVDKPLAGRQRFEVSTPVAVCGVRGTRFALVHERPAGGKPGNRGKTTLTVGTGLVQVRCLNPLLAGDPGMNLGRNQWIWVTWDGFGKPRPLGAARGQLLKLVAGLPGWVPDPEDPDLKGRPGPAVGGERRPGAFAPGGGAGGGAYEGGGGGFHNATGAAILGGIGLARGTRLSNMLGGNGGAGGAAGGDAGVGADAGDPVNTVPARPGQPAPVGGPQRFTDVLN